MEKSNELRGWDLTKKTERFGHKEQEEGEGWGLSDSQQTPG